MAEFSLEELDWLENESTCCLVTYTFSLLDLTLNSVCRAHLTNLTTAEDNLGLKLEVGINVRREGILQGAL